MVIRAGLSELTVSIRTIEDDVTEATETLVLELSVVDGPAVTGAVDRVTVSIVDDDEAHWCWSVVPDGTACGGVVVTAVVITVIACVCVVGVRRRYNDSQHRPF